MERYSETSRKQNTDFSQFIQETNHTITGWVNEETDYEDIKEIGLEVGYEEIEDDLEDIDEAQPKQQYSKNEIVENQKKFLIDGKPIVLKNKSKRRTFSDTHCRYTTYIDRNILAILRMLQETEQIDSITKCINDSVKEYLIKYYQSEN